MSIEKFHEQTFLAIFSNIKNTVMLLMSIIYSDVLCSHFVIYDCTFYAEFPQQSQLVNSHFTYFPLSFFHTQYSSKLHYERHAHYTVADMDLLLTVVEREKFLSFAS